MAIGRRGFLDRSIKGGLGAALGAATLSAPLKAVVPSDKVVVGIMGVGSRGTSLIQLFAQRPDVEIAYVCDVDDRKAALAAKAVQDKKGKAPAAVGSFEHILEDSAVDALVCATPDHWHSLATVLACQVGKDVYVESPASHSIWEGRKMVEAARKYNRVVQVGLQNRSSTYANTGRQLIQSGKLGTIHLVTIYNMMTRAPLENTRDSLGDVAWYCGNASLQPQIFPKRVLGLQRWKHYGRRCSSVGPGSLGRGCVLSEVRSSHGREVLLSRWGGNAGHLISHLRL